MRAYAASLHTYIMWLFAVVALIFPRLAAVALYFMTNWFDGIFQTWLWPILGFLFAPYALLWYTVVVNWYGGVWGTLQFIVLAIAILFDFASSNRSLR